MQDYKDSRKKSIGKGVQLAQLLNSNLDQEEVSVKMTAVAQMSLAVENRPAHALLPRMPEDVVVNSVYVECVGNSRHPSKSNTSILPSSISISAGRITNFLRCRMLVQPSSSKLGVKTAPRTIGTSVNAGAKKSK